MIKRTKNTQLVMHLALSVRSYRNVDTYTALCGVTVTPSLMQGEDDVTFNAKNVTCEYCGGRAA